MDNSVEKTHNQLVNIYKIFHRKFRIDSNISLPSTNIRVHNSLRVRPFSFGGYGHDLRRTFRNYHSAFGVARDLSGHAGSLAGLAGLAKAAGAAKLTRLQVTESRRRPAKALKTLYAFGVAWRERSMERSGGKRSVTVVPLPMTLCTSSAPPWASRNDLAKGNPRPVPL